MFSKKKKWNIKRVSDKEKLKIPKRVWAYLALIFMCVVGVVHVLRLPEYQVKGVVIHNAILTPKSDISDIVDTYMSYKYFYLVPQSNVWLYPKSKITERIAELTSISGVGIELDELGVINITVVEENNKYLWCSESKECFYMNEGGYIFARAPDYEGSVFLVFRGQIEGETLGNYFLTDIKMQKILNLIARFKELGLNVSSVDVRSDTEIILTLKSGTRIISSFEKDFDNVYINIKTLLNSHDFVTKSGGIERIDTIDMRYGKKAFWTQKNDPE